MYLRLLIGRDKGEIRDFPPEVATALLKNGRAENPYATPAPIAPVPSAKAEPRSNGKKVRS
jgi:hypothetical protein